MIAPDGPFRQWRKRLGLTQTALAERIGYSRRRIQVFDAGEEKPPLTLLLAMSAVQNQLPPLSLEDKAA
jgi:DNA-binding XRE family transcriptional regulator